MGVIIDAINWIENDELANETVFNRPLMEFLTMFEAGTVSLPPVPADVLAALLTVDGAGSGLDADLLDGNDGAYYLNWTNITNKPDPTITVTGDATGSVTLTDLNSGTLNLTVTGGGGYSTPGDILAALLTVDGTGSGLDADLLDGNEGAYYLDWTNVTNKPDPTITVTGDATGSVTLTDLNSGTLNLTVTGSGGASVLDDLSDVDLTTTLPSTGDVLTYDGANWVPDSFSSGFAYNLIPAADNTYDIGASGTEWANVYAENFIESSTIRVKEQVEPTSYGLQAIEGLLPVEYNKIGQERTEIGLIAEDVIDVIPEIVSLDDNGDPCGIEYSKLTVVLINAVKELSEKVIHLQDELESLKV